MEDKNLTHIEIDFSLFPRLKRVGHFISGLFMQMHCETPSEHFRGAHETLDHHLYEEHLPFVLNHPENDSGVDW